MTNAFITPQNDHSAEDRHRENEAIMAALMTCDDDTYQAVISVLIEAGRLP